MPPKAAAKKKAGGTSNTSSSTVNNKQAVEDAEIDEQLLKIDIWIDTVRKDIEAMYEPAIEEMRREVASMLIRLSNRVKNMRMEDFLRESGGDVETLIAKEKRQQKLARTTARGVAGGTSSSSYASSSSHSLGLTGSNGSTSSRTLGMTIAKPVARTSRVAAALMASSSSLSGTATASTSSTTVAITTSNTTLSSTEPSSPSGPPPSSSSSSSITALHTPGHNNNTSVPNNSSSLTTISSAATSVSNSTTTTTSNSSNLLPVKTPAMALMKSRTMLPFAGGNARTPSVSNFLPKTPGPDPNKRARVKRRNEMVYHVAVSENGSPILVDENNAPKSVAPTALVSAAVVSSSSSSSTSVSSLTSGHSSNEGPTYAGAIQIAMGDKEVLLDDEAKVDELEDEDALRMLSALEALQARVEQMKGKIAEKAAAAIQNNNNKPTIGI